MIDYIKISDLSRIYIDLADGLDDNTFEEIKKQAQQEVATILRENEIDTSLIRQYKNITINEPFKSFGLYRLLIDATNLINASNYKIYGSRDNENFVEILQIDLSTAGKYSYYLDEYAYYKIEKITGDDLNFYVVDNNIFLLYVYQALVIIANMGLISIDNRDIWSVRLTQILNTIKKLFTAGILYDSNNDGKIDEYDNKQKLRVISGKILR